MAISHLFSLLYLIFLGRQSSKKTDTIAPTQETSREDVLASVDNRLVGDDVVRVGVDDAEGLRAPSSRSSESGEINILDDFSEEEDDKDDRGERLKPYAENLEEAVALTMQVSTDVIWV